MRQIKEVNTILSYNIVIVVWIAIINLVMNQNYYPVDFEAQYEETSEKMLDITNKFKDKIRNIKPTNLQDLEQQHDQLQIQIDDHDLQFRKQSIYSQYASGQLMAEKRKQPPEMCPECGQELKKQVQCQFCAQIFCVKCCCRKRVIPFISKDIRVCCEQCHWKFVKLFDNKTFYEEKEKLANVIHFVKNKISKISEKLSVKNEEVEEFKKIRRDQKIKQKALDSKITQQEKKLKQIQEEFRRVISEKAQKMKEEERRRERQQQEREKARRAQEERQRLEQLERQNQQQRLKAEREFEQHKNLSASQKKLHDEQKEKDLLELLRKKEEELKRRQDQILKKEQQMKKQIEQSNDEKSAKSNGSINKAQTPKQSIGKSSERQKFIDTADTKSVSRSRRGSDESRPIENLVRTESTKSNTEQIKNKKSSIVEEKEKETEEQPADSLERSLVNMFKPKKEDDARSLYSGVSKGSKSILDMSVNELLAVRIPAVRTTSKIEEQQKPILPPTLVMQAARTVEEQVTNFRKTVDRKSIKIQQQQQQNSEMKMNKDSILIKNSSLISSTHKQTTAHEEVTPEKCACQIF